jgi:hypothetical protein
MKYNTGKREVEITKEELDSFLSHKVWEIFKEFLEHRISIYLHALESCAIEKVVEIQSRINECRYLLNTLPDGLKAGTEERKQDGNK